MPVILDLPCRPSIKHVSPVQLYGAGVVGNQTLFIRGETCLAGVVAVLDAVSLTTVVSQPSHGIQPKDASLVATVPMAGFTPGLHQLTLSDANGVSFGAVQIGVYA